MPIDPDKRKLREMKRAVKAGQPLVATDLKLPAVIRKGAQVKIIYIAKGVRLTVDGVAQNEAALGEPVRVLNTFSKRTIDAVVREARRPVRTDLTSVCDATTVVRGRVSFWSALAEDQGRRMVVDVPRLEFRVPVAEDDLADARTPADGLADVVCTNCGYTQTFTTNAQDLMQHVPASSVQTVAPR